MDDKLPRSTRDERVKRLLDAGDVIQQDTESILFQHSVLCQTGLPYRNPGDDVRMWERLNGGVHLRVRAGDAMHPELGHLVELGLPYGPKPRLILAHLNSEALRQRSATIEVDDSLTAFVKRVGLATHGRNIGTIKDQLARLSASHITLGIARDGRAVTINTGIVTAFDLWFSKQDGQRFFWPSTLQLSAAYFESLTKHAVPLHDRALFALSGSAMALDVYAWLAQRLHRIDPHKPAFIPWTALHAQFGGHYERVRKFREVFSQTVRMVQTQYRGAAVELDGQGMTLKHSPPPVKGRTAVVVSKG